MLRHEYPSTHILLMSVIILSAREIISLTWRTTSALSLMFVVLSTGVIAIVARAAGRPRRTPRLLRAWGWWKVGADGP